MKALINISKIITILTDKQVYNTTQTKLIDHLSSFNEVTIKGFFSVSKYNKYVGILLDAGFELSHQVYADYEKEGKEIDFRAVYKKRI